MAFGTYDKHKRQIYVSDGERLLDDMEMYNITPRGCYFSQQASLIAVIAKRGEMNLEEAAEYYTENHASRFADLWDEMPEQRDFLAQYYKGRFLDDFE